MRKMINYLPLADVAQSVELTTCNRPVAGSNPAVGSNEFAAHHQLVGVVQWREPRGGSQESAGSNPAVNPQPCI